MSAREQLKEAGKFQINGNKSAKKSWHKLGKVWNKLKQAWESPKKS